VDLERNRGAFTWGRKYFEDPKFVEAQIAPKASAKSKPIDRVAELTAYQNPIYAGQYWDFVTRVKEPVLREVVAKYLYKLMAYKDEYEVPRLLLKADYEQRVRDMWEAPESISYNLHPPLLRRFGVKKKIRVGRTMLSILRHSKFLRGTPFDIFGYSPHRKQERALIGWYKNLIEQVQANLTPDNLAQALEIAALPDLIRGYEQIKEGNIATAKQQAAEKLAAYLQPAAVMSQGR